MTKIANATLALLALVPGLLAAQPTGTTTLGAQLSTCIEQELKKEWGRPMNDSTGTILPGGWYPFIHICSNVRSQNLTFIVAPTGSKTLFISYMTLYTAKSCLEATKYEIIAQARKGFPMGGAVDDKDFSDSEGGKIECTVSYDAMGANRARINKPTFIDGFLYEHPDFPPWTPLLQRSPNPYG